MNIKYIREVSDRLLGCTEGTAEERLVVAIIEIALIDYFYVPPVSASESMISTASLHKRQATSYLEDTCKYHLELTSIEHEYLLRLFESLKEFGKEIER